MLAIYNYSYVLFTGVGEQGLVKKETKHFMKAKCFQLLPLLSMWEEVKWNSSITSKLYM